jgi:hypothetical protein
MHDRFRSLLVAGLLVTTTTSLARAQMGTISGRVTTAEGKPAAHANVMIVGTASGTSADASGRYALTLAPGTYTLKVLMVGYKPSTRAALHLDAGTTVNADFRLVVDPVLMGEITVYGDRIPLVDTDDSQQRRGYERGQMIDMPIDNPIDAITQISGVLKLGDEIHARGGRGDEVKVQIDGVSINDPLAVGTVEVGLMATADTEMITGGMDPEYGDAQSAVLNITTREGGKEFGGEFRYTTDDFGRADKSYTNLDRLGVSLGGPTWWRPLRYFLSGEATWSDTENTTLEPRPEHKLTDFIKFRERQSAAYNLQGKLTYNPERRVKLNAEAVYSTARSDDYAHNWNVSGYVGKVWYFQELNYAVAPEPGQPEIMEFGRIRVFNHGPWAEIKDDATRERRLHIRPVIVQSREGRDDGTQEIVTYTDFRAADLRIQNAVVTVVWDEATRAADGALLGYKPWTLFEGYQRQLSPFKPFLQDAAGADSSFVPFNSATHTPQTRSDNLQLKLGFSHNISDALIYALNVSRLDLHTHRAVLDENGDPKDPAAYSTAGLPVTLPNGTLLTGGITTPTWYTDDGVPYLVTAYDYPFYSDQRSVQWLMRGDVTSEHFKGHRIKTGLQVIYNDLSNDERAFPAQQRVDAESGFVQQGLDVNYYRSFNSEGAAYVQDKWEHEGMVVNGGLRLDWLSVGNNDEILITNAEIDPRVETFKTNLSPRLGIAFPITDRDKFFFHYGRFTQWPGRAYLFSSQNFVGTTGTIGNPNLEPELTVSYQAGIAHQFTDDIAGNFVVFNKDIYALISSTPVTDDSTGIEAIRFVNRTYASARGVEISLEKRLTRFGFEANYTYSFADGVASDADFGRSAAGLTHLPTDEQPLNWDQRHMLNVTLRLADGSRWGATVTYNYGSGLPWTPVDRFARRQDPTLVNSRRLEPMHRLNLQGRKLFDVYGRRLTFFFEGRNLLDDDILLPGGTTPGVFPALEAAQMDGGSYLTETGRYGGAYLQDNNDDGQNEFYAVTDPTIWDSHRSWRLGLGFEF